MDEPSRSIEVVPSHSFTGLVVERILEIIENARPFSKFVIALAGGSTPKDVYLELGMVANFDWTGVIMILGDERVVPLDDTRSNELMIRESLLQNFGKDIVLLGVPRNSLEPQKMADEYSNLVATSVGQDKKSLVDLMILGIGEDGHTASIFPGQFASADKKTHFISCKHPSDGTSRISVSLNTIREAKNVVFLIKGKNKAAITKKLFFGDEPIDRIPAKLFVECKGGVDFILDSEAAKDLEGDDD